MARIKAFKAFDFLDFLPPTSELVRAERDMIVFEDGRIKTAVFGSFRGDSIFEIKGKITGFTVTDRGKTVATGEGLDVNAAVLIPSVILGNGAGILIRGVSENDVITGSSKNDQLLAGDKNDIVRSGNGSDIVSGNDGQDRLFGGGGDDILIGGRQRDSLFGGSGDDILDGGRHGDALIGGKGNDTASYVSSNKSVRVDLDNSKKNKGEANGDTYKSIESVFGTSKSDTLRGDKRSNDLFGEEGNDLLVGRGGNDDLFGSEGKDRLDGGDGRDVLSGGSGNDRLTGGNKSDVFVFEEGGDVDRIVDFQNNVDVIDLESFGFRNADAALAFATEQSGNVIFDFGGGDRLIVEDATIAQLGNDIDT